MTQLLNEFTLIKNGASRVIPKTLDNTNSNGQIHRCLDAN